MMSNMGAVALRCLEDFQTFQYRGRLHRLTLDQFIERVYFRGKSVFSVRENVPSYIWWRAIREDGWGENTVMIESISELPNHRYEGHKCVSFSWIREIVENDGGASAVLDLYPSINTSDLIADEMIRMGLSYGQRVLSRVVCGWSGNHEDADLEQSIEHIYIEPVGWIDIPFSITNPMHNPTKAITVMDR